MLPILLVSLWLLEGHRRGEEAVAGGAHLEPAGETTEIEEAKKGWKDAIQRTLSRK